MKLTLMTMRGSTFWPSRPPSGRQRPPTPSPIGRAAGCHRPGAKLAVLLLVILALGGLSVLRAQTNDLADRIVGARILADPIVPVGDTVPADDETAALAAAVGLIQPHDFNTTLAGLEGFVATFPNSPWTPSIRTGLAWYYRQQGLYTPALAHWQAAWTATQNLTDRNGKRMADLTLARWCRLLASLGRKEQLEALVAATQGRELDRGPLAVMFNASKEALGVMHRFPGVSYRCGTFALNSMALALGVTNYNFRPVLRTPSPATGFSISALMDLARQAGLNLAAVERSQGTTLVVPSVVHWAQNHYAALVAQEGATYKVLDPTFGGVAWLSAETINAEASGRFLVPADRVPSGWRLLTTTEMAQTYGRGIGNTMQDQTDMTCGGNNPDCDPLDSTSPNFAPKNSTDGPPMPEPGQPCQTCGLEAMVHWRVSEPYLNVWLEDEPVRYQPSRGAPIGFQVSYKQRDESAGADATVFGVGLNWKCNLLCYADNLSTVYWPTYVLVTIHFRGGGESQRLQLSPGQPQVCYYNNAVVSVLTDGNGNLTGFQVVYPDGTVETLNWLRHDSSGNLIQVFIGQRTDPHGILTTFNYAPYDPVSNNNVQLSSVTDTDGRGLQFTYNAGVSGYPNLISQVTGPYGLSASLGYDGYGHLTSITDAASLNSAIAYDANGNPTSLTTPYGTTTFQIYQTGYDPGMEDNTVDRTVLVSDSVGSQLYLYYEYGANFTASFPAGLVPANTPIGTFDNIANNYRMSYYWNRAQYAALSTTNFNNFTSTDYLRGRFRHWLNNYTTMGVDTLSLQQDPSPDGSTAGQLTWYDYANKTNADETQDGTQLLPSVIARVLPDGTTWYHYYQRNSLGNVTSDIST